MITNIQKIRTMSPGRLALLLHDIAVSCSNDFECDKCPLKDANCSVSGIERWLLENIEEDKYVCAVNGIACCDCSPCCDSRRKI